MIQVADYKCEPIKNFTPFHEAYIFKLLENPTEDKFKLYIEHAQKPNLSLSGARSRVSQILAHPKAKEIVAAVTEEARKQLINKVAITREDLIADLQEIKTRCMQNTPVLGMRGNHLRTDNPDHDPNDSSKGPAVIGIYTFQPGAAIKAIVEVGKLLNYYETTVNVKHSVINEITKALPEGKRSEKQPENIDEAIYEVQAEIEADNKAMEVKRAQDNTRDSKPKQEGVQQEKTSG